MDHTPGEEGSLIFSDLIRSQSHPPRMSACGTKRTFDALNQCPLLGVKRTLVSHSAMSALTQSGHCICTPKDVRLRRRKNDNRSASWLRAAILLMARLQPP